MKRMFKIDKSLKSANVPRTIRFPTEMFDGLNSIARRNDVSFNLLVLQCCRYALDNLSSDERTDDLSSDDNNDDTKIR